MENSHQHAMIYSSTPSIAQSQLTSVEPRKDRQDFISSLVQSLVQNDSVKQTSLIESLRHQQQIIGTNSKNIHFYSKQKRKHLSRRANRLLSKTIRQVRRNAEQVRKKSSTFDDYSFMNELWKQYLMELCKDVNNDETLLQRCLTADYHGAMIRVVEAKNSTLLGKEGLVIQETKNAFLIVQKKNNRRCLILKKDCLFSMEIPLSATTTKTMFISGSAIAVRAEQRGQKRSTSIEYFSRFC